MKKIVLIIVGLAVVVAITAYLNMGEREDRLTAQREAVIFLKTAGEDDGKITFEAIKNLEAKEFPATFRSSDEGSREYTYTGVELHTLLEETGMVLEDREQVVARAADGYTVAFNKQEVLAEDNIYVVYLQDGEPLKSREDGGTGPYRIVIREDIFSQRWVKYLMEIDLK